MNIDPSQIEQIKVSFGAMETREEFLDLLNLAKPIVYGNNVKPFKLYQLTWHAFPNPGKKRYNEFEILKKSGASRIINAPVPGLKAIQKTLNFVLQCVFEPHKAVYGFVKGKSIVDNARLHLGREYVFNIDLMDFFTSIDQARVWKCLQLSPFNLGESRKRLRLANMIAALCCTDMEFEGKGESRKIELVKRNVLPQGAPTSPVLSNVVCQNLDRRLNGVAKKYNLVYSRYADDITFSSMYNAYKDDSKVLAEIRRIIIDQGFHINEKKTRIQNAKFRQEVTGLRVNEVVNVPKNYLKKLRKWLYYWERYGYERASDYFFQDYFAKVGGIGPIPDFSKIINGNLNYLKMVKGGENDAYLKLKKRFDAIVNIVEEKKQGFSIAPSTFNRIRENEKLNKNIHQVLRSPSNSIGLPVFHEPHKLVGFLKKFSENNSTLKFATHSWYAGRDKKIFQDLSDFLSKAEKEYNTFSYDLNLLSNHMNAKIFAFLLNKEVSKFGWGENRIRFGWSSPELLKICIDNPNSNPEDAVLPGEIHQKINGKTIQKFKQVIDIFKNEIEVRDENSGLPTLILNKHDEYLVNFDDPILENLDNKTFYTDVQWLNRGLQMIFENIKKRQNVSKRVKYSVEENKEGAYVLEILHFDSFNLGKSIYDEKLQLGQGDFGEIPTYLKNLCDWSIESKFAEGCYRINYLVSQLRASQFEKIDNAEGFKHKLTFYR